MKRIWLVPIVLFVAVFLFGDIAGWQSIVPADVNQFRTTGQRAVIKKIGQDLDLLQKRADTYPEYFFDKHDFSFDSTHSVQLLDANRPVPTSTEFATLTVFRGTSQITGSVIRGVTTQLSLGCGDTYQFDMTETQLKMTGSVASPSCVGPLRAAGIIYLLPPS